MRIRVQKGFGFTRFAPWKESEWERVEVRASESVEVRVRGSERAKVRASEIVESMRVPSHRQVERREITAVSLHHLHVRKRSQPARWYERDLIVQRFFRWHFSLYGGVLGGILGYTRVFQTRYRRACWTHRIWCWTHFIWCWTLPVECWKHPVRCGVQSPSTSCTCGSAANPRAACGGICHTREGISEIFPLKSSRFPQP
jgi:hypothetical protein